LGGGGYSKEQYSFNSPIELLKALKSVGVDMVTTANNHCFDRGEEGLVQTIQNLKECGIENLGTHLKEEKAYVIREMNGVRVGFLSFTYGTNAFANGNYMSPDHRYMVDLLQRQELSNPLTRKIWMSHGFGFRCIRKAARKLHIGQFDKQVYERREFANKEMKKYRDTVKKCKAEGVDYIIALLHIGGQYNSKPTDYTREMCEYSKSLGVNAVIANHEHVIHEIEWNEISSSKFCIYSLGNFLSATGVIRNPYDRLAQYSVAINIDVDRKIERGVVEASYSFIIFCNHLDEQGKVISEPFVDYIDKCDKHIREAMLREYLFLLNRIYHTEGAVYPIKRENPINYSGG